MRRRDFLKTGLAATGGVVVTGSVPLPALAATPAAGTGGGAGAPSSTSTAARPPWPRRGDVRLEFDFNGGWRFYRPPVEPPKPIREYVPPASALLKTGSFPVGTQPQDVMLGEHRARYVCLEAISSHGQGPFASVAEFYLLDAAGKPLPRTAWKIAYFDSQESGAGDLAVNAIDGNPETKWHSQWMAGQPPFPHRLVIDLGRPTTFSGFRYLPRQDGNPSGMIKEWRVYASSQAPPGAPQPEPQVDVSRLKDDAWESVNLPHTVRLEPLNASGGRNYQGVCWYRKRFPVSNEWKGKRLYLRFEGAMQVADVWLNGKLLHAPVPAVDSPHAPSSPSPAAPSSPSPAADSDDGEDHTHYGGYLPFVLDITPLARFGEENVLTVRLDNSDNPEVPPGKPQNALDFTYFGGLYRDVKLQALDPLHITDEILVDKPAGGGVFVSFPKIAPDGATVQVQTDVVNESAAPKECRVSQELVGPDGQVAAAASSTLRLEPGASHAYIQPLEVKNAKLWHPHHPDLYVLHTIISDGDRAVDDRYTRVGIRHIRFDRETGTYINGERFCSSGVNRHQDHPYVGYALPASAHYRDVKKLRDAGFTSYRSHYPQDPAFMDACDEFGVLAIVSNPGWQFVGNDVFKRRVYENARTMVRRDRNHPSVILWEAQMNESDNRSIAPTLYRVVHEEYPGDQCYTAGDRVPPTDDFPGWDVEYSGSNGQKPTWWREWGDQVDNWGDQQSSSRAPREWGETPLLVQAWSHVSRFDGVWSTNDGPQGRDRGRLCGADLWAGIDCYRGYHHQPFYGGPLDLFRIPKPDYFMFTSQRPVDVHVAGAEGGPMVYIANFGTQHSPTTITVFSNCDEVRLSQNGKEIATQKPDPGHRIPHPPFTFQAGRLSQEQSMLFSTGVARPGTQVGELTAEGLIGGQVVATHVVRSPGVQTQIVLEPDYSGQELVADGADWIRVYARLCDSRGTTYPYADDVVTFEVNGPGRVIGDASLFANPMAARAGVATALVQAAATPGVITVRATAFGLKPAEVQIESKPVTWRRWPA